MAIAHLMELATLREAPELTPAEQRVLSAELARSCSGCDWFTVGVMAATPEEALQALTDLQRAMGWSPLQADGPPPHQGPVFLKANQRLGTYTIRHESGLGRGVLLTGHSVDRPDLEGTWGPLPLSFFG
jgi:hypothetical protein